MDLPRPDAGPPGHLHGAAVLLFDGMGAELLDEFADDAPVLAGHSSRTLQVGFPATTVAGLAGGWAWSGRGSAMCVAPARGTAALVRPGAEPMESALAGQHGSLTTAEQCIPLLVAYG